jgi:hypothetical protein
MLCTVAKIQEKVKMDRALAGEKASYNGTHRIHGSGLKKALVFRVVRVFRG